MSKSFKFSIGDDYNTYTHVIGGTVSLSDLNNEGIAYFDNYTTSQNINPSDSSTYTGYFNVDCRDLYGNKVISVRYENNDRFTSTYNLTYNCGDGYCIINEKELEYLDNSNVRGTDGGLFKWSSPGTDEQYLGKYLLSTTCNNGRILKGLKTSVTSNFKYRVAYEGYEGNYTSNTITTYSNDYISVYAKASNQNNANSVIYGTLDFYSPESSTDKVLSFDFRQYPKVTYYSSCNMSSLNYNSTYSDRSGVSGAIMGDITITSYMYDPLDLSYTLIEPTIEFYNNDNNIFAVTSTETTNKTIKYQIGVYVDKMFGEYTSTFHVRCQLGDQIKTYDVGLHATFDYPNKTMRLEVNPIYKGKLEFGYLYDSNYKFNTSTSGSFNLPLAAANYPSTNCFYLKAFDIDSLYEISDIDGGPGLSISSNSTNTLDYRVFSPYDILSEKVSNYVLLSLKTKGYSVDIDLGAFPGDLVREGNESFMVIEYHSGGSHISKEVKFTSANNSQPTTMRINDVDRNSVMTFTITDKRPTEIDNVGQLKYGNIIFRNKSLNGGSDSLATKNGTKSFSVTVSKNLTGNDGLGVYVSGIGLTEKMYYLQYIKAATPKDGTKYGDVYVIAEPIKSQYAGKTDELAKDIDTLVAEGRSVYKFEYTDGIIIVNSNKMFFREQTKLYVLQKAGVDKDGKKYAFGIFNGELSEYNLEEVTLNSNKAVTANIGYQIKSLGIINNNNLGYSYSSTELAKGTQLSLPTTGGLIRYTTTFYILEDLFNLYLDDFDTNAYICKVTLEGGLTFKEITFNRVKYAEAQIINNTTFDSSKYNRTNDSSIILKNSFLISLPENYSSGGKVTITITNKIAGPII